MKKKNVFIVDDDKYVLAGVGKELESNDYHVTAAERGREALEIITHRDFHGYIIDLVLDDIDGLTIIGEIKKRNPDAPVLILTGYGDMDSAVKALRLGVDEYVEKPCESAELLSKLEKTISQCEARQKQLERSLQQCVKEKETMMREIHHRVKNNFSLISAIINLQLDNIINEKDRKIFQSLEERVHAFSLLHQSIYERDRGTDVDIRSYMHSLIHRILATMTPSSNMVDSKLEIEEHYLPMRTAFPVGLIITETVMNAVRHGFGFPDSGTSSIGISQEKKTLRVGLCKENGKFRLYVTNNGHQFPEGLDVTNIESMGLQLVRELTEQLEGTLTICADSGWTTFRIEFPTAV
jgi:two-component sensor histidine kinase